MFTGQCAGFRLQRHAPDSPTSGAVPARVFTALSMTLGRADAAGAVEKAASDRAAYR